MIPLQHLKELLGLSSFSFLVETFVCGLFLHLLRGDLVVTVAPRLPSGASADHRASVSRPLVPVRVVSIRPTVFIFYHHQISRHFLELVHQPLPLHLSQDASLIVVPGGERANDSPHGHDVSKKQHQQSTPVHCFGFFSFFLALVCSALRSPFVLVLVPHVRLSRSPLVANGLDQINRPSTVHDNGAFSYLSARPMVS